MAGDHESYKISTKQTVEKNINKNGIMDMNNNYLPKQIWPLL